MQAIDLLQARPPLCRGQVGQLGTDIACLLLYPVGLSCWIVVYIKLSTTAGVLSWTRSPASDCATCVCTRDGLNVHLLKCEAAVGCFFYFLSGSNITFCLSRIIWIDDSVPNQLQNSTTYIHTILYRLSSLTS